MCDRIILELLLTFFSFFLFFAGQSDVLVVNGPGALDRGRHHRRGAGRLDAEDRNFSRGRDVDVERCVGIFFF